SRGRSAYFNGARWLPGLGRRCDPGRRVEPGVLVVPVDLLLQRLGPLGRQGVVAEEEVLDLALVAVLRREPVPERRGLAVVVTGFVHVAQPDAVGLVFIVAAERVAEGGDAEGGRLLRRHLPEIAL